MLLREHEARHLGCPADPTGDSACVASNCPLWRWHDASARVEVVRIGWCAFGGARPPSRMRDGRLPTAADIAGEPEPSYAPGFRGPGDRP